MTSSSRYRGPAVVAVAIAALAAFSMGHRLGETESPQPVAGLLSAGGGSAVREGHQPKGERPFVGKPRPPVRVHLAERGSLQSGVPGQVVLKVMPGVPVDSLSMAVEGDAGLVVTAVERVATRETRMPGSQAERPGVEPADFLVFATPLSGGHRQVSGQVRFTLAGTGYAVPFSLGVEVRGPVTLLVVPSAQATVEDDAVDSMRAETTVLGR